MKSIALKIQEYAKTTPEQIALIINDEKCNYKDLAAFNRKTAKFLEKQGFDVSYLDVDSDGVLDVEKFRELLRPDTILVSVMHVNNETGVIQPVNTLKRIIKEKSNAKLIINENSLDKITDSYNVDAILHVFFI